MRSLKMPVRLHLSMMQVPAMYCRERRVLNTCMHAAGSQLSTQAGTEACIDPGGLDGPDGANSLRTAGPAQC